MSRKAVRQWIKGLISAAASGASGVFGMNLIDPQDFNLGNMPKLFAAATVCGLIGIINFLVQSPLPDDDDDTVSMQRFTQEKP